MNSDWVPGAIIILGVFGMGQIGTLVWFISKMDTLVNVIRTDLDKLAEILKEYVNERYTDRDAVRDFTIRDQQIKALWEKVDRLKDKMEV